MADTKEKLADDFVKQFEYQLENMRQNNVVGLLSVMYPDNTFACVGSEHNDQILTLLTAYLAIFLKDEKCSCTEAGINQYVKNVKLLCDAWKKEQKKASQPIRNKKLQPAVTVIGALDSNENFCSINDSNKKYDIYYGNAVLPANIKSLDAAKHLPIDDYVKCLNDFLKSAEGQIYIVPNDDESLNAQVEVYNMIAELSNKEN